MVCPLPMLRRLERRGCAQHRRAAAAPAASPASLQHATGVCGVLQAGALGSHDSRPDAVPVCCGTEPAALSLCQHAARSRAFRYQNFHSLHFSLGYRVQGSQSQTCSVSMVSCRLARTAADDAARTLAQVQGPGFTGRDLQHVYGVLQAGALGGGRRGLRARAARLLAPRARLAPGHQLRAARLQQALLQRNGLRRHRLHATNYLSDPLVDPECETVRCQAAACCAPAAAARPAAPPPPPLPPVCRRSEFLITNFIDADLQDRCCPGQQLHVPTCSSRSSAVAGLLASV